MSSAKIAVVKKFDRMSNEVLFHYIVCDWNPHGERKRVHPVLNQEANSYERATGSSALL